MIEDLYAKLREAGVIAVPDCCVCDDRGCEFCPAEPAWPEYAARMDLDPQDMD
jgi:hypothetical protein